MNFFSSNLCAQSYVKMKVENNLPLEMFKNICQKLTLVVWNKYCSEINMSSNPPQTPPKTMHKFDTLKEPHFYERRLLTQSKEKRLNQKRRVSISNIILGRTSTGRPSPHKEVSIDDISINEIIEEDDHHLGDFGYAEKLTQQASKLQLRLV
jgi:hypothetical protein